MAIQKGTGFTNLNRIMQANKGNKLGQAVSGGIQSQAQGVQSQVKSAQEQFQEEAQKNRLDTGESAQKRQEILNRFAPSTGATQQGAQAPVSEQEIKDFTKFRTGTYTGPKELQDATSLYGKAQQAEQLGGLTRSEGGRQELLRRFVGGNDYTQGQRQLDTSILGQKPGQLGQAARQARGATERVDQANIQASNLAQEYANRAKAFGQETVQKIGETKAPLSQGLDTRVQEAQKAEQARLSQLKGLQDVLGGAGDFSNLDQWTRSGLALQEAADSGIISGQDIDMLLGRGDKIGLLQRGANLGLDMNKMISERLTSAAAQNVGRTGIASEQDIARLNALDRLAGKEGTDLEFLQGLGKYQAGKTGFNTGSLLDYISKTEGEKAAADKAYADKLAAEKARYLNQSLAYGGQTLAGVDELTGGLDATKLTGAGVLGAGAGLGMYGLQAAAPGAGAGAFGSAAAGGAGAMAAPAAAAMVGMDILTGKDTTAQTADTAAQTSLAGTGATQQGANAIYEGLLKLNVGGKSIANTEAGQQLLKALAYKSQLENQAIGEGSKASSEITGEFGDMTKSALYDPLNPTMQKYYATGGLSVFAPTAQRIAENLSREVTASRAAEQAKKLASNVGGAVGKGVSDIGKSVGGAVKSISSGGGIKISDEELKTDINYDPKDLQRFMDRIKPAAYDYKDEVKDSPLASKNRELGVMAQDLEKSKLGKEAVSDTKVGKVVDYDNLEPKMLASIAALNQRLKELESKK